MAAAECAANIRKFLGKDYLGRPSWQYNAIMLVRILSDHPGEAFTRNLDQKFVDTARTLLAKTRDRRVRQILMETLDDFQYTRAHDGNLVLIVEMWKVEKDKAIKQHGVSTAAAAAAHAEKKRGGARRGPLADHRDQGSYPQAPPSGPRPGDLPPFNAHSQNYFARDHGRNRLPDTVELASRLEEARTSAKLLEQVVMNTPPAEILDNDLIKEFADRCLSASRSIQGYMVAENPSPDNDTMESLIDTNEQLQTSLNQHQRAVLSARKQLGHDAVTPQPNGAPREWPGRDASMLGGAAAAAAEEGIPPRKPLRNGKGKETDDYEPPPGPPPGVGVSGSGSGSGSRSGSDKGKARGEERAEAENPFEDPFQDQHADPSVEPGHSSGGHVFEPFNPGFREAKGKAPHDPAYGDTEAEEEEEEEEEDLYEATPVSKEPMYRY